MVLTINDELRHPIFDIPEWRESMWYCFQIPELEMGGAVYYSYMPNKEEPSASYSVYLTKGWVEEPNSSIYSFARETPIPDGDWDDLNLEGILHYKRIEPLKHWTI